MAQSQKCSHYLLILTIVSETVFYSGWTEEELFELNQQISTFRIVSSQMPGLYQASAMRTCEWHSLSHLVEAKRQVRRLQDLDTGVFESSHKKF